MAVYNNKEELKNNIINTYNKYIKEFNNIPEENANLKVELVEKTPFENLAYQVGWTTLLLKWEKDEKKGVKVKTPTEQYRWNQLGELYKWFYKEYHNLKLSELKCLLDDNVEMILNMIDELSSEELFEIHKRQWCDDATKNAAWTVAKFIHINTVAPFKSFRTKIRKYKKTVGL